MASRGGAVVEGVKPTAAMVAVEFIFSALQIFIKLALDDGMDVRILVAYRLMFAAAFLCPLAFLIESHCCKQNLLVLAMKLTNSTTIVTALSNLTPQSTFIVAILSRYATFAVGPLSVVIEATVVSGRLETVKLGKASGREKLSGTLVCLGGAMVVTFYSWPEIKFLRRLARTRLVGGNVHHHDGLAGGAPPSATSRIVGSFLAISSCFSYAIWLTIQAKVGEVYPCHYSIAALVCLSGAVHSALLALCLHRDAAHLRLGLNVRLYSSAYAGIVASGLAFPLMSWCLRKRGPLYVAMFGPLIIVFVAVLSSIFLDETLHLGIALGAVLIVAGLYMVLWGKAREEEEKAAMGTNDEELGKGSDAATDTPNGETK
ncbi:hypothetical protein ACP4OV_020366 [Aristida adscensionis]